MGYLDDYNSRTELISRYGNNALLLYALELRFDITDIYSVAADALTDGGNDKKCDLIYVDQETGVAVIAQSYMKQEPKRTDLAPGNKASDLNTAAAWAFSQNPEEVPEQIREQISLLQASIQNNTIGVIYFWYVHNLNECNNPQVKDELNTMQASARTLLAGIYPENEVEVFAVEVGNETIEKWYNTSIKQITVTESFIVNTSNAGFELCGEKWKAYITAVSANWIKSLYSEYKDDLFSGNPRNYLGSGKKKNKINLGIMETISTQPENFWVYNNGITALVNDYSLQENESSRQLNISGITIINGAQTTGAISNTELTRDALIPIRFIVCDNAEIVDNIIYYNNKQNDILPSDLRSNDQTQNRLRVEFDAYSKLYYSGGRRGNIRPSRSKVILDPYVVAQAILAFHGDCVTAYNSKNELWSSDQLYRSIFPEKLTAKHIILTYSLARSIDAFKLDLQMKGEERIDIEDKQYSYLSKRGAKMLLIYTVSRCMESIVGKKIRDSWSIEFLDNSNFNDLVDLWKSVIKVILPMSCFYLEHVVIDGLKSKEESKNAADLVVGFFASMQDSIRPQIDCFIKSVEVR